jgi:hypothetical protein
MQEICTEQNNISRIPWDSFIPNGANTEVDKKQNSYEQEFSSMTTTTSRSTGMNLPVSKQ